MKQTINFTLKKIDRIEPNSKTVWYYDEKVNHFALSVSPKGAKTYYLYKWHKGRPLRIKLGRVDEFASVEDARSACRQAIVDLKGGYERDKIKAAQTQIKDIFSQWMADKIETTKRERTTREYYRLWDAECASLASLPIGECRRVDIKTLHEKASERPTQADRTLQMIRACFNWWIITRELELKNPASSIPLYNKGRSYRALLPEEMRRFVNRLKQEPPSNSSHALMTMLLTGARPQNVFSMKWADLRFDESLWIIPPASHKTGDERQESIVLPLSSVINDMVHARFKLSSTSPWVFPNPHTKSGHMQGCRRIWRTICKDASVNHREDRVALYSLRHTYSGVAEAAANSTTLRKQLMGHTSKSGAMVDDVYNNVLIRRKIVVQQKITDHIWHGSTLM